MGRKQSVKRYKNFFYPACCIIISLFLLGCQYNYYPKLSIETVEGSNSRQFLKKARDNVAKKDFKTALENNKKAYDSSPPALKQEAIFQKALIYAHPDNPDQNYEKAMVCLDLIDSSQSKNTSLAYNSSLIFSILKENCGLAKKASYTSKGIRKNRKKMEVSKKKIEMLEKEQKQLKEDLAKLRKQIRKLKEVDLSSSKTIHGVLNE